MKKIFHLLSLCFCALALIGCENKQSNSTIENIETGYLELNKYSIFVDDLSWKNSFIVAGFDNQDIEEIIIPMDGHSDELNEWAGFKENAQNENRAFLQYLDCSGSGFAPRCECVTGFNNCPNLKRVIFKSYVDFIQPSSGTNSALDSEYHDRGAKLANKVNIENAFNNCPNLSEIIFENLDVSTIGNKNNLYPRSSNEYQETDERIQIDSSKFAFSFGKCFQNASFKHLELPFYVHISQDISFKTRNIKVDGLSKEENESIRQDDFYSCLAFNNSGVQTLIASAPSQTRIINTNLSTIEHYSQKQFAINQDDDLFDKDEQNSFFHFNGNMPNLKTFSTLYLGLNELVLNNNGKYISESRNNNAITIFGLANASINIEKVDIKDLYFTGTGVSHHFENCFNNSNYIDGLIESGVEERNVFRVYKNCFNYNVCPENLLISNKEIRLENCFNNINSVFISLNPSIQVTESFKNINSLCKYSGQWGDDLLTNSTANVEEIEIIQSSTLANESFNVKKLIIDGGVLKANSGVLLDKVEELVIKNDGIVNDVSFNGQIKMLPNVKYLSFVDCNYITGNWSEHQNLETILFKANENGAVVENLYFGGCTALKRINLIGNFVHGRYGGFYFRNCTELEEVTLEGSIDKLINGAFCACKKLKDIEFAKNAEVIGNFAFCGCELIKEANLDKLLVVEAELFRDCSSLKTISLPSATTLKAGSSDKTDPFANCSSLESIDLPFAIDIQSKFIGCVSLKHIYISNKITNINSSIVSLNSLEFIKVNNLNCLGDKNNTPYALISTADKSIVTVTLPDTITTIACSSFSNCSSLTNVVLNKGPVFIGENAFYNCRALNDIHTVDASKNYLWEVVKIGKNAFYNCSSLGPDLYFYNKNDKLSIESETFTGCSKLYSITDVDGGDVGSIVFVGKNSLPINIQYIKLQNKDVVIEQQKYYPKYIFITSLAKNITIDSPETIIIRNNSSYPIDTWNCNVASIEKTNIYGVEGGYEEYGYVYYGEHLMAIIAPSEEYSRVDSIQVFFSTPHNKGSWVIYDTIASFAFRELTYVKTFDLSLMYIKTLPSYLFAYCTSAEKIIISNRIENIKANAFSDCSNLDSLFFEGTMEEWENIAKDNHWKNGTKIGVIHCNDGDLLI